MSFSRGLHQKPRLHRHPGHLTRSLASFFAWSLLVNLFLYKIRSIIKTSIDPASVFRKNSMSKPVAIITGAASGIGLSLTRHLLSSGWRVAMADRNEEKGRALETELGPDVMFMTVDVSKYDQQAALFQSHSNGATAASISSQPMQVLMITKACMKECPIHSGPRQS